MHQRYFLKLDITSRRSYALVLLLKTYLLMHLLTPSPHTPQVRSEVDDSDVPLIGLYGHSAQELVNLFLCGTAVTNVFDGDRTIGAEETSELPPNQPQEESVGGFRLR